MARVLIVYGLDGGEVCRHDLRLRGFEVDLARSPDDALDALRAPDVVLTDCTFRNSRLSGAAFVRELRRRLPGAVIIAFYGFYSLNDRRSMRDAGADQYRLKFVLAEDVVRLVEAAVAAIERGERLGWNWPSEAGQGTERRVHERRRGERRAQ